MKNLFKANSDRISRILMTLKISLGTLGASSYAMGNEKLGFWILISIGILDVILSSFSKNGLN